MRFPSGEVLNWTPVQLTSFSDNLSKKSSILTKPSPIDDTPKAVFLILLSSIQPVEFASKF